MEPCGFPQANLTMGPPKGVPERGLDSTEGVGSLRVFRGKYVDGRPAGGRLWVAFTSTSMPPVSLSTDSPF